MRLLARVRAVAGAMEVQDHVVPASPLGHRLDGRVADHQIDHDDDAAEIPRELGPLVHILHRGRGDVEVVTLDLAGRCRRAIDRLHAEQEPVAPVHERLGVDVLVVLRKVEPTLECLVDDTPVIPAGQAELRLGRRTEERPTELVQALALHHDARGRAVERLHVCRRETHILQAKGLEWLEAEYVADDRGAQVGDRTRFEEREVVGDVGEELVR